MKHAIFTLSHSCRIVSPLTCIKFCYVANDRWHAWQISTCIEYEGLSIGRNISEIRHSEEKPHSCGCWVGAYAYFSAFIPNDFIFSLFQKHEDESEGWLHRQVSVFLFQLDCSRILRDVSVLVKSNGFEWLRMFDVVCLIIFPCIRVHELILFFLIRFSWLFFAWGELPYETLCSIMNKAS